MTDKLAAYKETLADILAKGKNDVKFYPVSGSERKLAAFNRGMEVACGCHQTLNSHVHTFFSVQDGISSPEAMVDETARKGYGGMGTTDHGVMGGVLRAGRQAKKNWKTGRLKSNLNLVNYTTVDLGKYFKDFTWCLDGWTKVEIDEVTLESAQEEVFDAIIDGTKLTLSVKEPARILTVWKAFEMLKDSLAAELTSSGKSPESVEKCLSDFKKSIKEPFKKVQVTHNAQDTAQFRLLYAEEFDHVGDFKALSGCELYVSWQAEKDKKYHHVTVYATGMTGHRALILLTSIGSIPSRLYVGGHGFFRPRVFFEDIKVAMEEADGELIMTTGCPISYTSVALKEDRDDDARKFFAWAQEVVPPGNFFAELHICDVSLDFNRLYSRAEDKVWASLFSVPVSRLRLENKEDALNFALRLQSHLRNSLGVYCDEGNEKSNNEGGVRTIRRAGSQTIRKDLPQSDFSEVRQAVSAILNKVDEFKSRRDIATEKLNARRLEITENAKKLGRDVDSDLFRARVELNKLKKAIPKARNQLDDETLQALSYAKEASDGESASAYLARFFMALTVYLYEYESPTLVNPLQVAQAMMAAPATTPTVTSKDKAKALLTVSSSGNLALESGQPETVRLAAEALSDLLFLDSFGGSKSPLAPSTGSEDEREREWLVHPEGNWMEKVNKKLVAIAKEFDVPLLIASDAHMTTPDLIQTQDAIVKKGKPRNWHMARPYSIPRADIMGFIEDAGADYTSGHSYIKPAGNCGLKMLDEGCFSLSDLIESFGSGSMILDKAKSCGDFKWYTVVPKIRVRNHVHYAASVELLESGGMKAFLDESSRFTNSDGTTKYPFTDRSMSVSAGILVVYYNEASKSGKIVDNDEYRARFYKELYMLEEVHDDKVDAKFSDFFLVLSHAIGKFRDAGVSVGPGRGSAAGMLMAYLCGITQPDPVRDGLLDDRWMTAGRKLSGSQPDIDVDVNNREIAGRILAEIAAASLEDSLAERPASALEKILHSELFYSAENVAHEYVGGRVVEIKLKTQKKDLKTAFAENIAKAQRGSGASGEKVYEDEEISSDDTSLIEMDETKDDIVWNTSLFRVGTLGSLKAKAAVKEAIRICDDTPFENLPSFGEPTPSWKQDSSDRLRGLDDEGINRVFENEKWGHLAPKDRIARRRIKLADRITKAMTAGSGTARLYQSEKDFFAGSVYGIKPAYWEDGFAPPRGSIDAAAYFDSHPEVKKTALSALLIAKSYGVHAGGFCFGREALERLPLRADRHGFVAQPEMKDVEIVGVLKFDILGLKTLNHVSGSLQMIVNEVPYDLPAGEPPETPHLSWWMPRDKYDAVKAGASTDILWPYMPMSTIAAIEAMAGNAAMTFQIDTPNIQKDLVSLTKVASGNSKTGVEIIKDLVRASGDPNSAGNRRLLDILDAILALWRPGPMGSNSHIEYFARLLGAPYTLIHPWIEPYVRNTWGIIAYQEQVMKIYFAGAGGPDGTKSNETEVEEVRRALGKKDMAALLKMNAEEKFVSGCVDQQVPENIAREIWLVLVIFAEYGFNYSHSKSYALITGATLFLKTQYRSQFFKVIMGLANADEAGRFLSEIHEETRPACALTSGEVFWEVIDGEYFPGLNMVEGLSKKDLPRLLAVREGLSVTEALNLRPEQYFSRLLATGNITETFAKTLSTSGLLRHLGTPKDIAEGYKKAIIGGKNREAAKKKEQKNRIQEIAIKLGLSTEGPAPEAESGNSNGSGESRENREPNESQEDEAETRFNWDKDDADAIRLAAERGYLKEARKFTFSKPNPLIEGVLAITKKIKTGIFLQDPFTSEESFLVFKHTVENTLPRWVAEAETLDDFRRELAEAQFLINYFTEEGRYEDFAESVKQVKLLNAADRSVYETLSRKGLNFIDGPKNGVASSIKSDVLDVPSAYGVAKNSKIKGLSLRFLNAAVGHATGLKCYLLRDLKAGRVGDMELRTNECYMAVAFVQDVRTGNNQKTGKVEYSVKFQSEGATLNAKFSNKLDPSVVEEAINLCKDMKRLEPLFIKLYAGTFTPPDGGGSQVSYFKIESVEKISLGKTKSSGGES